MSGGAFNNAWMKANDTEQVVSGVWDYYHVATWLRQGGYIEAADAVQGFADLVVASINQLVSRGETLNDLLYEAEMVASSDHDLDDLERACEPIILASVPFARMMGVDLYFAYQKHYPIDKHTQLVEMSPDAPHRVVYTIPASTESPFFINPMVAIRQNSAEFELWANKDRKRFYLAYAPEINTVYWRRDRGSI